MLKTYQTAEPVEHHNLTVTNRRAVFFVDEVADGTILLDPPYQRGVVWSVEQQMGLVKSWLLGLPTGVIILSDRGLWPGRSGMKVQWAVVDGKQRITAAQEWMSGRLAVPASWFPADEVDSTEETSDGPYVRFTGLAREGQLRMQHHCHLATSEARLGSEREEAHLYVLINGGGVAQTVEDMERARRIATGK